MPGLPRSTAAASKTNHSTAQRITAQHSASLLNMAWTLLLCMRRLYLSLNAAAIAEEEQEDADWRKSFKLSYSVGSAVVQKLDLLSGSLDARTSGSHLLRLSMQHHQMTAPPTPIAGQGTPRALTPPFPDPSHPYCLLSTPLLSRARAVHHARATQLLAPPPPPPQIFPNPHAISCLKVCLVIVLGVPQVWQPFRSCVLIISKAFDLYFRLPAVSLAHVG